MRNKVKSIHQKVSIIWTTEIGKWFSDLPISGLFTVCLCLFVIILQSMSHSMQLDIYSLYQWLKDLARIIHTFSCCAPFWDKGCFSWRDAESGTTQAVSVYCFLFVFCPFSTFSFRLCDFFNSFFLYFCTVSFATFTIANFPNCWIHTGESHLSHFALISNCK